MLGDGEPISIQKEDHGSRQLKVFQFNETLPSSHIFGSDELKENSREAAKQPATPTKMRNSNSKIYAYIAGNFYNSLGEQ
jgi:hypothetical protein